jgi:hypothetical protein
LQKPDTEVAATANKPLKTANDDGVLTLIAADDDSDFAVF